VAVALEIDHDVSPAKGGTDGPAKFRPHCRDCHLNATRQPFGRQARKA
jgi:hypothetical protein